MRKKAVYLPALVSLAVLCTGLLWPLAHLLGKSLTDMQGIFAGLANFYQYFQSPGLTQALYNTLAIGFLVTIITVVLACITAFALTHTQMIGRGLCQSISLLSLFVPSIFPSLGLIYLLGNQGILRPLMGDIELYGPFGIALGSILYAFPHAVLLLTATLRDMDVDLYHAARTLGAGPFRRFFTITLPGIRYGLTSAALVVFILTITDFGVPKVLGGNYAMLATEIFQQVTGLQNFTMASTISLVLLSLCIPAFSLDAWAKGKQRSLTRGNKLTVTPHRRRDMVFTLLTWGILLLPLSSIGLVVWGSFIGFWPYNYTLSLANYSFQESTYGFAPFINSLLLATGTALVGTLCIFMGAYTTERCTLPRFIRLPYRLLAILPLCIPGTVLGLAFVLAFNAADGLWAYLNGTLAMLIFNSVIHFYTVCHFTCIGGLSRLCPQYEDAGAILGVSRFTTFYRVIIPLQRHTLADVAFYLFVSALTTISGVVFLYTADSMPASIAILQMADTGRMAEASAMGTLILLTALGARGIHALFQFFGTTWNLQNKR